MTRAKKKKSVQENAQWDPEDLRFGTPEIVANYRAERLRCSVIAEIGCGVGFQTAAFAKTCDQVYAVEKDARKLEYAKKNTTGLTNITFLHGDAFDPNIIKKLAGCEIVFCDTERSVDERRSLESLSPNPVKLIEAYAPITPKIAIEVPPFLQDIPFACEKEYISVHGALNRLTLYLGPLQKAERSVVALPAGKRLESSGKTAAKAQQLTTYEYIYDPDPAVAQAGLLGEVDERLALHTATGKSFFLSKQRVDSPFVKAFRILAVVEQKEIVPTLQKLGAGTVVLRYRVEPKDYWKQRQAIERQLQGKKKVFLFQLEKSVIAEEVSSQKQK